MSNFATRTVSNPTSTKLALGVVEELAIPGGGMAVAEDARRRAGGGDAVTRGAREGERGGGGGRVNWFESRNHVDAEFCSHACPNYNSPI